MKEVSMSSNGIVVAPQCDASPLAVRADRARYPRVKDVTPAEGVTMMMQIVGCTQIYANRKTGKEELLAIARALYAELLADDFCKGTRYLAWVEIERAIRRGILGAGKEMYGISVSTLYQAILNYMDEVVTPAQRQMQQERKKVGVDVSAMCDTYAGMMARANEERKRRKSFAE